MSLLCISQTGHGLREGGPTERGDLLFQPALQRVDFLGIRRVLETRVRVPVDGTAVLVAQNVPRHLGPTQPDERVSLAVGLEDGRLFVGVLDQIGDLVDAGKPRR